MEQNLRVADLLAMDAAGTRLIAGEGGIERRVLWAHSCEMPEPYRWLGPNELLMTVGLCIPADGKEQAELVRRLEHAGLAGMTVGDDQMAPELRPEMLAEADRLAFPLMITHGTVPFASIGRIVAAANSTTQTQQVLTLSRLYQAVLEPHEDREGFMRELGRIFHVALCAIDVTTGATVLPGGLQVTPEEVRELAAAFGRVAEGRSMRVGSLRHGTVSVWQVSTRRRTALLVDEGQGSMLDSFTLVHLSRVVAMEADRRAAVALAAAGRGRQVLTDAYSGDANFSRLEQDAAELGLRVDDLVAAVMLPENEQRIVESLSLANIAHASAVRKGYLVSLLSAADLDAARSVFALHGVRAGISPRFSQLGEVREAALRAQWAHESVRYGAEEAVTYDEAVFSISPRSESEAREVIEHVLGPLRDGNGAGAPLLETLCVYLDEDRNWASTAQALGIHRQTLAYRLARIEKLTGRSLKSTRDLAEFWVARIALKQE
ncbi:hypothetical protein GCM10023081_19390 [Arthrobacter ginkgonis]|uniref:PucR family transcriptional regulator n=1 Tax=Arthrobacter ginkgonis TaxID=1630594 RepID=A0ABP7CB28_9MICC